MFNCANINKYYTTLFNYALTEKKKEVKENASASKNKMKTKTKTLISATFIYIRGAFLQTDLSCSINFLRKHFNIEKRFEINWSKGKCTHFKVG